MSRRQAPYAGVYENIDFPEYRYQEFPKMLLDPDGKPLRDEHGKEIIVNSIHEELRAMDGRKTLASPAKRESEIENLKLELAAKDAEIAKLAPKTAKPA